MPLPRAALLLAVLLAPSALAARVTVPGTTVSFEAPEGWAALDRKLVAVKYARGQAPRDVLGTKNGVVTIAYELRDTPVPEDRLAELLPAFVQAFGKQFPTLKWYRKGLVTRGGLSWVELEFETPGLDDRIYNRMLLTSYRGKLLVLNANSTAKALAAHKARLDRALNSVRRD